MNCIPGGVVAGMMAGCVVSMGLPLEELSLVPGGNGGKKMKCVYNDGKEDTHKRALS